MLRDLVERVRAKVGNLCSDCQPTDLDEVVAATVIEMGYSVTAAGDIYNPAPAPDPHRQSGVRWSGGGRRVRGRR